MAGDAARVDVFPSAAESGVVLPLGGSRAGRSSLLQVTGELAPARIIGGEAGLGKAARQLAQRECVAFRLLPLGVVLGAARDFYTFAGIWKPRVLAEFDRASGDGTGPTYGRFDPLFGMRRADLGPVGLYNAIGRSNILSPGIRLELTPSKRIDAFVGYRAMRLADRHDAFSTTGVKDGTGKSGSFAGHQIDARLRQWIVPAKLRVEADATVLVRGSFLRAAPNGPTGNTRYVSLNLTGFF